MTKKEVICLLKILFCIHRTFSSLVSETTVCMSSLSRTLLRMKLEKLSRLLMTYFVYCRFLCSSSSATLRRWSNIRVSSIAIFLVVLFIALAYLHIPITYVIRVPQKVCSGPSDVYQTFLSLWNLIIWSWLPTAGMIIFGLLTVRNIHQGKRRILPQNVEDQRQQSQKKTDAQLVRMMLFQSLLFGLTTMSSSLVNLYASLVGLSADNLLSNIFASISLTGPCMSFYLFTLSSQLFRRELMSLFHRRLHTENATTVSRRN